MIIPLFYVVVHTFTDFVKVSFCEVFMKHMNLFRSKPASEAKASTKSVKRKRAGYGNKSPYLRLLPGTNQ